MQKPTFLFHAVIYNYTYTGILPRKGYRGRVTVIGIACFKIGLEKESLWVNGKADFDPFCTDKLGQ
jgi:hypothetical protein